MTAGQRGIVLGKFMPPHLGHLHLLQVAQRLCEQLTVVVDVADASAPIPIHLRRAWLAELAPAARIVALETPRPQHPDEHPQFWEQWRETLATAHGTPGPDVLFAGEDYGARLARDLGARFVLVGPRDQTVPIQARQVRADPMGQWRWLPPPVRAHYCRRISVFGPESTGKSTLAQRLARHFDAALVPEFARSFLEGRNGPLEAKDLVTIAAGQAAAEDSLARLSDGRLICDTDPLATLVWNEFLGDPDQRDAIAAHADRPYDLTLLLAPDVPWVGDSVRYLPDHGEAFFDRCRDLLQQQGRHVAIVEGHDWEQRWQTARRAVDPMIRGIWGEPV